MGGEKHLQSKNAVRDDVHDDGLGEGLGLLLHNRLEGLGLQRSSVVHGSESGRAFLALIGGQNLVLFIRARRTVAATVADVTLSVEQSLLLGGTSSSVALGHSAKQLGKIVANLASTVPLGLLLSMRFVEVEEANNDANKDSSGAEEVRKEVRVSVPDGSAGKDLGVADARSGESSSDHGANDGSRCPG